MDAEYANYYTREVMLILIREFQSPDEEMKKIVLKVCQDDFSAWILNMNGFFLKRNKILKASHKPYTDLKWLDFYFLSGGKAVLWYRWCGSKLH